MKNFKDILNNSISDELLAAYIDGNTTESENALIEHTLNGDSMLAEANEIVKDCVSFGSNFDWELHKGDFGFWELGLPPAIKEEAIDINNGYGKTDIPPQKIGADALNVVSEDVRQQHPDTCAIKAQQILLNKCGIEITEDELRNEAIVHGWYRPRYGTPLEDVGNLMELHGIKVNHKDGDIYEIINELAKGHGVIMAVDSGELYNYSFFEKLKDFIPFINGANHALIVSGINTENPKDVKIMITDPWTGDVCKEYSFDQFADAAKDANFHMITTSEPIPHIFDSFGEGIDYLPMIGNLSYSRFLHDYAFFDDISKRPAFEDFYAHLKAPITTSSVFDREPLPLVGGILDDDNFDDDGDFDDDGF